MLHLTLLRHAKAEPARPGMDDHDRPLASRGWDDAPRVARLLSARGLEPDLVLHSTARRCVETWEAVRDVFGEAPSHALDALYLAEAADIASVTLAAAGRERARSVLVIGHNPGLHDLAVQMSPAGGGDAARLRRDYPTSSAATFCRQAGEAEWRLVSYIEPRDVREA